MNIATLFALTIIMLNEYVDKNDVYLLFLIKSCAYIMLYTLWMMPLIYYKFSYLLMAREVLRRPTAMIFSDRW
jgi:hypothetical protein